LAQGSGDRVFGAMQPQSPRPKRSLLAKTLCLVALLGAVYLLADGMPNTVTGAFAVASFVRPVQAGPDTGSRIADVIMQTWPQKSQRALVKEERDANIAKAAEMKANFMAMSSPTASELAKDEVQANLAKAAALREEFKSRNPNNYDLPQWLPFGEKMVGGRDEGKNYHPNRKDGQVKDWSGKGWTFWTF